MSCFSCLGVVLLLALMGVSFVDCVVCVVVCCVDLISLCMAVLLSVVVLLWVLFMQVACDGLVVCFGQLSLNLDIIPWYLKGLGLF